MSLGIILVSARDPLSNLTSLIYDTKYTAVGIYQEGSLHLYDIWRSETPLWFVEFMKDRSYVDSEVLLSCDTVESIKLYPIESSQSNRFRICIAKILSMEDEVIEHNIFNPSRTGYDVINYILYGMTNLECKITTGSLTLIENTSLLCPVKKSNKLEAPNSFDIIYNNEVNKIVDNFKDLYLTSSVFRDKISNMRRDNMLLEYILLDNNIRDSIKTNTPHNLQLRKLNDIRDRLGLSVYTSNDYGKTYDESLINSLNDLRGILQDIIDKRDSEEPIVINVTNIITACNIALKSLSLATLNEHFFYSNTAILTSEKSIDIDLNKKYITIRSTKLETYSKQELKEILKVVNEISTFDPKYVILQNSLIKELSRRA